VIVYETDDKKAYISALNPVSALEVIKARTEKNANEVSEKLKGVVAIRSLKTSRRMTLKI